jgi:hypothetical protein
MIALAMTLSEGVIEVYTLSIVVSVTLLSGLWLFLSKNKNEM